MALVAVVLDAIVPLYELRPRHHSFEADSYVNQNDYFTLSSLQSSAVSFVSTTSLISVDSPCSIQLHYDCGIFAKLS